MVLYLGSLPKTFAAIFSFFYLLFCILIIEQIEKAENLSEISKIKKLVGHKSAYRVRMNDFRIGFFFEDQKIILARIVHRKDIYKLFP